ncbi:MAG: zinc finger HIT domain-containing protein [Halanaeroarchaeum sp.]
MSVEGLCGICEREPARYVCDRCGTPVCETHYDRAVGRCLDCATSADRPPDHVDSGDDVLR